MFCLPSCIESYVDQINLATCIQSLFKDEFICCCECVKFVNFLSSFDLRAYRWAQVMIFAIEEINRDPSILPNTSLGYRIYSSCASPTVTLRAALTLANIPQQRGSTSPCPPATSALIASSGSSQSAAVAGIFGPFQVPIVRKE